MQPRLPVYAVLDTNLFDTQEGRLPGRPLFQPQLQALVDHVQQDPTEHQEGRLKGRQVHGPQLFPGYGTALLL